MGKTAITFVLAALAASAAAAEPPAWRVDGDASRLGFEGTQGGSAFEGSFERFEAEVHFDEADLENSSVRVDVDVTSAEAGAVERTQQLPSVTWFDTSNFPNAVYEATGFERLEDNRYRAAGTLSLKGISREVPLTFTIAIDGGRAVAEGRAELVRTEFDVGTGEFTSGSLVGLDVAVLFRIEADREG
ncbi:MAG: YceI family protein [Pseudomonadota bacterium]